MELNYIKFDTAKLAKELGFDIRVPNGFDYTSKPIDITSVNNKIRKGVKCNFNKHEFYSRPNQQELQRWLREKYGLCAYIDWEHLECKIINYLNKEGEVVYVGEMYADTPEDDLEDLLKRGLEYIKEYKWINVDEFNLRKHGK